MDSSRQPRSSACNSRHALYALRNATKNISHCGDSSRMSINGLDERATRAVMTFKDRFSRSEGITTAGLGVRDLQTITVPIFTLVACRPQFDIEPLL
jgi:hypothetical protein